MRSGRWEQLFYKISVKLRGFDYSTASLAELGFSAERSKHHNALGGPDLEIVFRELRIRTGDRILDIGCGKGAALVTLAKFPFSEISGVDLSSKMLVIAKENLRRAKITGVQLFCSDAAEFRDLDRFNYMYLFNPFPCNVMKGFLQNIADSITRNARCVTLVYAFPVCESLLLEEGMLKVREFQHLPFPIAVYRTQDIP